MTTWRVVRGLWGRGLHEASPNVPHPPNPLPPCLENCRFSTWETVIFVGVRRGVFTSSLATPDAPTSCLVIRRAAGTR